MGPVEQAAGPAERVLDDALAEAILAGGRQGVRLEELWRAAFAVEPELGSAVDRRARLRDALDRLAAAGQVATWPTRPQALDRRAVPSLPLVVRPVAAPASRRPAPAALPNHLRPELAGARDLGRLRAAEVTTLSAVNDFLRDFDRSRPQVPIRERSLEIFGDEKRLDALRAQRLYTSGVLSDELLGCFPVHPPFVYERVTTDPVALVVENHHTYDSARRALTAALPSESAPARGIGVVAYGAGRAFCASVSYLADLDPPLAAAYYFGDLRPVHRPGRQRRRRSTGRPAVAAGRRAVPGPARLFAPPPRGRRSARGSNRARGLSPCRSPRRGGRDARRRPVDPPRGGRLRGHDVLGLLALSAGIAGPAPEYRFALAARCPTDRAEATVRIYLPASWLATRDE